MNLCLVLSVVTNNRVRINDGPVYKTMLSLGVNPSFNTKEDTVEAYIFHNFAEDFYGEEMTLIICGFIRPSENYKSLGMYTSHMCVFILCPLSSPLAHLTFVFMSFLCRQPDSRH